MRTEPQHSFLHQVKKSMTALGLVVLVLAPTALAADLSSTSFIVRDPHIGTGGGYGTSTTYKMFNSGNNTLSGYSTSTSFQNRNGFQYYPHVVPSVLSETTVGSDADLTWTATTAEGGLTTTSYSVGIASVSGGPYTYTSVGTALLYNYTSLLPGTYYMVVETFDALGNVIALSNEVTATITEVVTFSLSANSIGFGNLTTANARYATTTGGSGTIGSAHTITAGTNAATGYSLTYTGPTLTKGTDTIAPATITADADGTPGTTQFGLSIATTGGATITTAYKQSLLNWAFVANSATTLAATSAPASNETFSNSYIGNISTTTAAGDYSTALTYTVTANF